MTARMLGRTARQIADVLGAGWSAGTDVSRDLVVDGWRTTLHGPDRIALTLVCARAESGRWRVFGQTTTTEEATVAGELARSDTAKRPDDLRMGSVVSPERMAELIQRDYLPGWLAQVAEIRAVVERRDASRARVHAVGEQIIAALGGRAVWQNPDGSRAEPGTDPDRCEVRYALGDGFYGYVRIRDDGITAQVTAIDLVVTGPPEPITGIIEHLATLRPG